MTVREIIKKLEAQGHIITWRERSDGGVLITSIDGKKYTGAKGNSIARTMIGVELSKKRESQLSGATKTKKLLRTAPQRVKERWRKVRDLWRKTFKPRGGKPNPAGTLSWKRIKYALDMYGEEEAMRRLDEAERYAQGLAYTKNVEALAEYIAMYSEQLDDPEMKKEYKSIADTLMENIYMIREEWIPKAYEELYKINAGKNAKEVARRVRRILHL